MLLLLAIAATVLDVAAAPPDNYTVAALPADEQVVRIALVGSNGGDVDPIVAIYPDGSFYVPGAPPVGYLRGQLTAEGLDRILGAAAGERLLDQRDYGDLPITDVGSTVVTISVDQGGALHSAWALGYEDDLGGMPADQLAARQALSRFVAVVTETIDDARFLAAEPAGYAPETIALYPRPLRWNSEFETELDAAPVPWPLATPLPELTFGSVGGPCAVLGGADAATILGLFDSAGDEPITVATGVNVPAVPPAVSLATSAVLPGERLCTGDDPDEIRPLERAELPDLGIHDFTPPWPADRHTTVGLFERWAAEPVFFAAISAEVGPAIDWTESTWFDTVAVGAVVDGHRFVDLQATCSPSITDEYEHCELWGRFDPATGEIVELAQR